MEEAQNLMANSHHQNMSMAQSDLTMDLAWNAFMTVYTLMGLWAPASCALTRCGRRVCHYVPGV